MKKYFLRFLVSVCLLFLLQTSFAQQPPFYDEIQAFKKQDSLNPPPQHAILFVGSSSFHFWTDVQDYFPGYPIINRGFGGSSLPDVIRYANDIIFPYHPKQVVIYCGENDLAMSDAVTEDTVFNRFKILFELIRSRLKDVPVVYVSIKPSPSRARLRPKMEEANGMIKDYLSEQKNTAFVDVYYLMLNGDYKPMPEIFKEDSLHMNAKGYAIWQKAIQPYLIK
jgi:lysophospholipase L1-like esterase